MAAPAINLSEKFSRIGEHWSPRVVAQPNGQHVKLAKLLGTFVWHKHDDADELFLVVKGRLTIEFCDGATELAEGELCVVPRGVEHRPVAAQECHVLLFEPAGTLNTGDAVGDPRTVAAPQSI